MTAPIKRPNPILRLKENRNRVIALEQVPRLGMGVELKVDEAEYEGSTDVINNWEVVNDPHGYYDLGSAASGTEIIIPEGLGGIYMVSLSWRTVGVQ